MARGALYRVGVETLGSQACTVRQLLQIVGDSKVRSGPDVAVSGTGANPGIVDGRLGLMRHKQASGQPKQGTAGSGKQTRGMRSKGRTSFCSGRQERTLRADCRRP